jgi:hypothetical protein
MNLSAKPIVVLGLILLFSAKLSIAFQSIAATSLATKYKSAALNFSFLDENDMPSEPSRRSLLVRGTAMGGSLLLSGGLGKIDPASASLGTLPEFFDTNAILQGLTVNVADKSQQKSMIDFLINGFGFQVLRQRISSNIEETVRRKETGYCSLEEGQGGKLLLVISYPSLL